MRKIREDPLSGDVVKLLAVTSLGYEKNTTSEILAEYIACCLYPKESLEDNLKSIEERESINAVYNITKIWYLNGIL